jgi:Zn-dependent M32 family carboxypeptidase
MIDTNNEYVQKIVEEYNRATEKFRPFQSKHEGISILREEFEELWEVVKADEDWSRLEEEAVQVGAMALRFLNDVVRLKKSRRNSPKDAHKP